MIKRIGTGLIAILLTSYGFSQQNDTWKLILENNRNAAIKNAEKDLTESPGIESLVNYELARKETGKSEPEYNFLQKLMKHDDWEMYLYALWNESFLMGNYIDEGFRKRIVDDVNALIQKDIQYQSLQEGVYYIKAITDRRENDLTSYKKYTDMISSIREWQFCGAFENLNNSGIDAQYEPETAAFSRTDFNANSNGFLNWYPAEYSQDGYIHMLNHAEYGSGVHYAQTFIKNEEERDVWLRLGASSKMRVWVNDVMVYEATKDAATDVDAYNVKLRLPAGTNRLLIKLAEPSTMTYFIARITDKDGKEIQDLTYTKDYLDYNKSTKEELQIEEENMLVEDYFINKTLESPDNFLYNYCLMRTYLRNEKHEKAKEIAEVWYEKYPKSSLMRFIMIQLYNFEEDQESIDELRENMKYDDEDYYVSYVAKFSDVQELFRMSYADMVAFLDDFARMMDDPKTTYSCALIKALRLENLTDVRKNLDKLVDLCIEEENIESLMTYLPMYSKILDDETRAIKHYKKLNKQYFDGSLKMQMARYYADRNQISKVLDVFKEMVEYSEEFTARRTLVSVYQDFGYYEESEPLVWELLRIYPYSFIAMERLGDVYLQRGEAERAIEMYKKSLIYNSGNSSLRNKIRDIRQLPDIVEDYIVEDVYEFVKEERGKIEENNYGYNILLDQSVVQLYPEAGGKKRITYVYEVTSSQGVDRLTEYNLGLYSGFDIIKSEIIKKNGSIVPADANYSSFVFNGLEEGDVVYIDFETYFNGWGRFYKDYESSIQMDSYHPISKSTYTMLVPDGISIDYKVMNGELTPKIEDVLDYTVYTWEFSDKEGKPSYESYMPDEVDEFRRLHVSTIDSWSDIAFWYSDLVRSQLEINSEVQKVKNELFPEADLSTLSDNEKARRIYRYLTDNFNYSHVSFRQSGYVPQMPSKTIKTKLGDCKDLSTLFVALAQMVDLKSNLVLVLTGDNGENALVLPSQAFNHCIVKVNLDGEERYLELTDKYLPYKALPAGLTGAAVLNIPYKYNEDEKYELEVLRSPLRAENVHRYMVNLEVDDAQKNATIDAEIYGASRSFYRSRLDDPNYKMIKEKVKGIYGDVLGDNMKVDSVYNIVFDLGADSLAYRTKISAKEKVKKIGGIKIIEVPSISDAYNGAIIEDEDRKYTIDYSSYERIDKYETIYTVTVPEGNAFTDLPENVSLTFKDHSYERSYELVEDNKLMIKVVAIPGKEDISTEDYFEFKNYVSNVLEAKEEFIGYQ